MMARAQLYDLGYDLAVSGEKTNLEHATSSKPIDAI